MPTRIRIEATEDSDQRYVVYLYVAGYRFELTADSASLARKIALDIAYAMGLEKSLG